MDELIAFWSARLDEDEYHAKAAQLRAPGPWMHEAAPGPALPGAEGMYDANGDAAAIVRGGYLADYLTRRDPACVLGDVEADRRLLTAYAEVAHLDTGEAEPEYAYGRAEGLGEAVRLRAARFSGHADYLPQFAPRVPD